MKLSILIPVYNYNITELVEEIVWQAENLAIEFEVLVFDDASTNKKIKQTNQKIDALPNVLYKEFDRNVGQTKIRNQLFKTSKGEWLLFLDADTLPVSSDFLNNYFKEIITNNSDIISGGIEVRDQDKRKDNQLRWKYSKINEKNSGRNKNENPGLGIRGANFLIRKKSYSTSFFLNLPFQYGYMDTVFGIKAEKESLKIKLIDNPVYHLGLESSEQFLHKSKEAVRYALYLNQHYPNLAQEIRLIKMFRRLKNLGLLPWVGKIYKFRNKKWEKNLTSQNPSLKVFQLYKIGYMSLLASEKMESNSSS